MSRRNFWDVIQNTEINPLREVNKISMLFSGTQVRCSSGYSTETVENHINNKYFLQWGHRGTSLNIADFCESKKIINPNKYSYSLVVYEQMFLYFELVVNMIALINIFHNDLRNQLDIIMHNINSILEHYNQKLFKLEEEGIYIIVENSQKATSVSELYPDIASKIIQYNRFSLKGDLQRKKELLFAIGHKFEGVKAKLKQVNKALCDDTTNLLNNLNIRHNNEDKVKNISDEELEKWYDRTYDILLLSLLYVEYSEYQGEIPYLNKVLNLK